MNNTFNARISVALVDDNALNRSHVLTKLELYPDLKVNLVAKGGHEFLESLKGLPSKELPSVVFMDIEMPELNGIETIRLSKSLYPNMQFIVLTVFEDEENIFEAIQAGASGYLLKHESHEVLYHAILEIMEFGGAPMSPAVARKTLRLLSGQNTTTKSSPSLLETLLSDREREILHHMVNGYDAKRIAELTAISVLTVRKHISNIYIKLHVNSKSQVISLAHKNNWVN